jgi:hypothetical protein
MEKQIKSILLNAILQPQDLHCKYNEQCISLKEYINLTELINVITNVKKLGGLCGNNYKNYVYINRELLAQSVRCENNHDEFTSATTILNTMQI